MEENNLKQKGYFLIRVGKTINIDLWSEDKEELQEYMKKNSKIVPYYINGEEGYIELDGKLIRIE